MSGSDPALLARLLADASELAVSTIPKLNLGAFHSVAFKSRIAAQDDPGGKPVELLASRIVYTLKTQPAELHTENTSCCCFRGTSA